MAGLCRWVHLIVVRKRGFHFSLLDRDGQHAFGLGNEIGFVIPKCNLGDTVERQCIWSSMWKRMANSSVPVFMSLYVEALVSFMSWWSYLRTNERKKTLYTFSRRYIHHYLKLFHSVSCLKFSRILTENSLIGLIKSKEGDAEIKDSNQKIRFPLVKADRVVLVEAGSIFQRH